MARRRTPHFVFEYLDGGAEDEIALRRNRQAFDAYRFAPRTLVDTADRHCGTTLFGAPLAMPVVVAPTGINGMVRPSGDLMLARAAARAGVPFCLSTVANARAAEVVLPGARLWMQLYIFRDPRITADVVRRADEAGCEALLFTTDANVFGAREWDQRSFVRPGRPTVRSALDALWHGRWLADYLLTGFPRFVNVADFFPPEARSARAGIAMIPRLLAPAIDWDDVARLRDTWRRKLILKGVLAAEDAERAVRLGCDGIVLTNHGGRQLDSSVAPFEVLPQIARAFRDRLTILVDSGIRRGSDIAKAVALGAHAVLVGRATLYGLAAGGEAGVARALEILLTELHRVLGQLGCRTVADLEAGMLVPGAPTTIDER
jgi:(S)-mandelate dehydrogenase